MAFKILSLIRARFFSQASDSALEIGVNAEEHPRFKVDAGGRINWGSGTVAGDTNLYRDEANVLKTDDTLKVPSLFVDGIEIDTTNAQTDDILIFNGTAFTAASVLPGQYFPTVVNSLDDLTDVVITSPDDQEVLTYDKGTDTWINETVPRTIADLSDTNTSSAVNGNVLLYDGSSWTASVLPTNEPMGFENRTDSVVSFNNSTRVFSIAPASTSFTVWCAGKKYVKSSAETVTIPNTTGLYFIYYSNTGVLSYQTDYFTWDEEAPTAYVYWNATTAKAEFFADERHGIVLDWQTHEYLHRTRGASIANGFGIGAYTIVGDGTSDTHLQVDIANGTFFDEDLQVDTVHSATPTANTWEQVLQGAAEIPIFYRSGTAWVKTTATTFPVKQGTLPQYNSVSGGSWSATDLASATYGVTYVVATNNLNEPVLGILGQAQYANLNKVHEEGWDDLNLEGLPIYELRPLYKLVYLVDSTFTNTPKAVLREVVDLRAIASTPGAAASQVNDHGSLLGLSDDDHSQYVHLSNARTVSAVHTFSNGLTASLVNLTGGTATALVDVVQTTLTSTTSDQTLDSTASVCAKYVIHADDGSASETVEILAVRRGSTVNHVEYGFISTGESALASYSVAQSAGNILLRATPTSANTTFVVFKTTMNM